MPPTVTQLAFRNPRRAEIDPLVGREDELEPSAVLSDGSSEELAQNGRGVKRAPPRAAGSFPCLGARIRALCASELFGKSFSIFQIGVIRRCQ
jgi:hypothetical protein